MRHLAIQIARKLAGLCPIAALGLAVGCAQPYGVPPASQLVAEAPGEAAAFSAPDSGTVYVSGPSSNGQRHLIYTGWVRLGETITVDPANQRLVVDGKRTEVAIHGGNAAYQIWFKPIWHDWHDIIAP